jgi:hypothetical protein
MNPTILDSNFKSELNKKLKDIDLIVNTVTYHPVRQNLTLSMKILDNTTVINDEILNITIDIRRLYSDFIKINKVITINKLDNIEYTMLLEVIDILTDVLNIFKQEDFLRDLDIIKNIAECLDNLEDDKKYLTLELKSIIDNKTDLIKITEYVLYKEDIPYFKLYGNTTMLISCKVLLERFVRFY